MVGTTQFFGYTNGESVNTSFYMREMDFKEAFFAHDELGEGDFRPPN
jgi:hypothetical protein